MEQQMEEELPEIATKAYQELLAREREINGELDKAKKFSAPFESFWSWYENRCAPALSEYRGHFSEIDLTMQQVEGLIKTYKAYEDLK